MQTFLLSRFLPKMDDQIWGKIIRKGKIRAKIAISLLIVKKNRVSAENEKLSFRF